MANRVLSQKLLKNKRRGKYKLRSGAPSKSAERVGPTSHTEDADGRTTTGEVKMIAVGEIRFSSQVVNNAANGKPYRKLWQEAEEFLKNYHSNIPIRR